MPPAWRAIVRSHLPALRLPADREADIVEEIAQQLEDTYNAARARGVGDEAALAEAMAVVKSWPWLATEIEEAERSPVARLATVVAAPILHEPEASGRLGTLARESWQDLRHGVRVLARHRVFALTAILTLALAIGATTAIFSLVHTVLLKPLPFPEPDRLTVLSEGIPELGADDIPFSAPDYADFAAAQRSFETVGAFRSTESELSGGGSGERIPVVRMTAGLFDVLRVPPALGRVFTNEEDASGQDVVVLSDGLWRERFGADPNVLGRTLLLDRRPLTVIGVMPAGFSFPMRLREGGPPASLFIPITFTVEQLADRGGDFDNTALARLRPGATLTEARAEADTLIASIFERYPEAMRTRVANARLVAHVDPLHEKSTGRSRPLLLLLLAAVGALLLIGCANISNLLLVLATSRRKEIALRVSLGAGRERIVRQLIAESVVLAAIGGSAGVTLAATVLRVAPTLLPSGTPRIDELAIDGSVLAFTALISLGTALVFGLAPSLQASRVDMRSVLADSSRGSTTRGALRVRAGLVVSQCAMAIVLLVAAGLLLRTFLGLMQTSPGFRPEQALAATTYLPAGGYRTAGDLLRFYRDALAGLSALPGVVKSGASTDLPLGLTSRRGFTIEGRETYSATAPPIVAHSWVAGDYLAALGVPLLAGRWLSDADREGTLPVVVISSALANRFWPNEDALGRRLRFSDGVWLTVVGIAGDVKDLDLASDALPHTYMSLSQATTEPSLDIDNDGGVRSINLVVSTAGDPAVLTRLVRTELARIDSQLALGNIRTMQQSVASTLAERRFTAVIVATFAVAALLLAALGLHGVLAYSVSQRSQEIGIRMALGAARRDVVRLVLSSGLRMTGLGVAIGLVIAFGVSRFLNSMLYGISATDPLTFAGVASLLIAVALIATWLPTRQAVAIDPAVTMREG